MDGILIIDKPAGITSHDVVYKVRRILKTKRVGHTGTLDPFATGVMVVLVGQATRLARFLDKDEKAYEAVMRFGFETDTGDLDGLRTADRGLRIEEIDQILQSAEWNQIFVGFRGEINQTPPMYSAKKVDGKKLYELARKGETTERKPVSVTISRLELIESAIRDRRSAIDTLRISVACSAGTYIRTLAEDIGRKVGIGAHLVELRRTASGRFTIDEAITLDNLAAKELPADALVSMETAVSHLNSIVLNEDRTAKTRSGLSTRVFETTFADGEMVRMLDPVEKLIAIGRFDAAENVVQPKVVLV